MRDGRRSNTADSKFVFILLALVAVIALVFFSFVLFRVIHPGTQEQGAKSGAGSSHMAPGNPSNAGTRDKNNYLMVKRYFALAYNNAKGTPNWVSWRLTADDLGNAPREPFYPDEGLPAGFARVTPRDYTGSGFDRGHMCPHSDRSASAAMSRATFVMTNLIPQSPNVNQKAWEALEEYCRELAKAGKTLYIIAGPAGRGGTGRGGERQTIGREHKVTVPAKCWKVIMVLEGGGIKNVSAKTRLIAVVMPNDMSVGNSWAGYRVSVAEVEKLTGYTFFDKVPESVIAPLKTKVDRVRIAAPRAARRGERSGGQDGE